MKTTTYTQYRTITPYLTKDGSLIRELMHPQHHGNREQSLAEAEIPAKTRTFLHIHYKTEELYHVTQGHGTMILGNTRFNVSVGDTIYIPSGTPHAIEAHDVAVKILCCCSPAYSHEDTELCSDEKKSSERND